MKIKVLFLTCFITFIIYASVKYSHGIVGTTKLNGEGCTCHNLLPDTTVKVWITGPDSVVINSSKEYKIYLTGGPKVLGGFNAAVKYGIITNSDTGTVKIDGELAHKYPMSFNGNDTIMWSFTYTPSPGNNFDTLYVSGNSTNGDGMPTELDRWNFGANFPIKIYNVISSTGSDKNSAGFENFILEQNFPNPFNPATTIKINLHIESKVDLIIYNISGEQVYSNRNNYLFSGEHSFKWNAGRFPSGVYYYSVTFENSKGKYSETKKMILMK